MATPKIRYEKAQTIRLEEAAQALASLGLELEPRHRSAPHALLALLSLETRNAWSEAKAPLLTLTQLMDFTYAYPHMFSRDLLRRDLEDLLIPAGLAIRNPDSPDRPINSSKTTYQIPPQALALFQTFGTPRWESSSKSFAKARRPKQDRKRDSTLQQTEAFILFNTRESGVQPVVQELESRGVSTSYWGVSIQADVQSADRESQFLRESGVVLVFLGKLGWAPNHLHMAREARQLQKRIIPIVIGQIADSDLDEVGGLFRNHPHLDLSKPTSKDLDRLFRAIRAPETLITEEVSDLGHTIIETLIRGDDTERMDAIREIDGIDAQLRAKLSIKLRNLIEGGYSGKRGAKPPTVAGRRRDINSVRSWMLSALICADCENLANRDCILRHLNLQIEHKNHVRFWTLAGLFRINASYLPEAVRACAEDPAAEVASLSWALQDLTNKPMIDSFRAALGTFDSYAAWPILKTLRIVPIVELVDDVCRLVGRFQAGSIPSYSMYRVLTHPHMAARAASILSREPGTRPFVEGIIVEVAHGGGYLKRGYEYAIREFGALLNFFDPAIVDVTLEKASANEATGTAATSLIKHLALHRGSARRLASAAYHRTYSAFVPDRAVYGPRSASEPLYDAMGVGVYADHMAHLIAARDTWMPLSIGLFGPWGSGKSHFIDLLHERLAQLTQNGSGVFHEHVVQIHFNAWHYLDTNLWASIVCEIFDQLFAKLENRSDTTGAQVDKLKEELAQSSTLAAEARDALRAAENARAKAESSLTEAIQSRTEQEAKIRSLLDDVKMMVTGDEGLKRQLEEVADALALRQARSSYSELESRVREVRSFAGRLRALAISVISGPGAPRRLVLLVLALATPLGVAALAEFGPERIRSLLSGLSRPLAEFGVAAAALSTWLSAQVKNGSSMIDKLEGAYRKVADLRAAREKESEPLEAQKLLALSLQRERDARLILQEAEARMLALQAELDQIAPGRQLIRFLRDRVSAESYRRHLGLAGR